MKSIRSIIPLIVAVTLAPAAAEPFEAFFKDHCIRCHGPEKEKGDMRLDQLPAEIEDEYAAETWQEVLDVLNGADMPPEDEPQPSTDELAAVIGAMTDKLFDARKRLVDPKSVTIRRLNKREYANTIRDLLGVPIDTASLPADGTLDGFDTIGDAHFMSAPQFEKYLELGRVALDRALVAGPAPQAIVNRHEPEGSKLKKAKEAVEKAAADVAEKKKLLAGEGWAGDDRKHYDQRLKKTEDTLARATGYLKQPAAQSGFILKITQSPFGGQAHDKVIAGLPKTRGESSNGVKKVATFGDPIGHYVARFRAALTCAPKKGERLFVEVIRTDTFNMQVSYRYDLGTYEITRTMDDPHVIEVPFENTGELGDFIAVRVSKVNDDPDAKPQRRGNFKFPDSTETPYVWVDWLEVEGPILEQWPPVAWTETFFNGIDPAAAEEGAYAREIIARFAKRAFRGHEASSEFLTKLHEIYEDYRSSGSSFVDAVKEPLAVILASPSFVYLVEEPAKDDGKRPLSDLELASRLSYLLWSHPPDAELLGLASAGQLTKADVLRGQVERMLKDPRADHFTDAFISQWLELEWLDMIVVSKRFPVFNETIRASMREEPIETFRQLIREDLSVTNFIDSDFVVIDGVLSKFYGIETPGGDVGFQKVGLPAESPRGGLLGTGAVLTMTGTGERTSPVERGVFVYTRLLGKEVSPPPPNVPQLVVEDGTELTVRQLLEEHTNKAQCASCHRRMDPLGFGLEHFNAIGRFREGAAKTGESNRRRNAAPKLAIDATGVMPDREREFSNHEELKAFLMEDRDQMAAGFLKAILTYSLGRRVGFSDGAFVEQMQADWKAKDYAMRDLIHAIVQSDEFQSK